MTNSDLIYLERLIKRLQAILKRLNRGKTGSAYFTKAEIRSLSNFIIEAPTGLSGPVRSLYNETKYISKLSQAKRQAGIFYLNMLLSLSLRLLFLLEEGDRTKLKAVQRELKAHNVMQIKRKTLNPHKDADFENIIVKFLKTGNAFNDHIYKNIEKLPELYLYILDYYLNNKKDITGTKQWYDFLVISNFMLYGIKLEMLELKKLRKC